MKPNLTFLQKVADGKVKRVSTYGPMIGRSETFQGGETMMRRYAEMGYITMPPPPRLLHTTVARLTDAGRRALWAEGIVVDERE